MDCLSQAFAACGKKIVLSSVILDYCKDLLDSETMQRMLSECDWRTLKAYDFMVKLIEAEQPENLKLFLESSVCHVKHDTILELLRLSDFRKNTACNTILKNYI